MARKYVVTGGPCYGKTTLVDKLGELGYYSVQEAARLIIDRELNNAGKLLPWTDRLGFQKEVIKVQKYLESKIPNKATAFLDRGILDNLAYFWLDEVEPPEEFGKTTEKLKYTGVFLLEELPNYVTDSSRREDPETARRIQDLLKKAYGESSYDVIEVPPYSPKERAEFVTEYIKGDEK